MSGIVLLNIAWQSLLFTAIGWAVVRWAIRDARHRAWTALLTLILAVAGPLALNSIPPIESDSPTNKPQSAGWQPDWKVELMPTPPELSKPAMGGQPAASQQTEPLPPPIYSIFLPVQALWMLGAVFMGLRHLGRSIRAFAWHQRLRQLTTDEVELLPLVPGVAKARVFVGPGSPCVSGLLRPVVAIPDDALSTLSTPQWRAVFLHEMEHLRGQDTRLIWCLEWLEVIFWWNPFFHGLVREWSQAREEICDHTALETEGESSCYAELLLLVAGWSGPAPCRARMASPAPVGRLKSRIQAILHHVPVAHRPSRWFVLGYLLLSAGLLVAISGTGLAEPPDKRKASTSTSPAPEESGELITVTYRIPTGFLPVQPGESVADTVYRWTGTEFREGAKAEYIEDSMLFIRNTGSQHRKFSKSLDTYTSHMTTRIRFETKWVEIDTSEPSAKGALEVISQAPASGADGIATLTAPQMASLHQSLAGKEGVHLLSAPKVITISNQKAKVGVTREVDVPTGDSTREQANFIGVRNELEAIIENDRLRISVVGEVRTLSGIPFLEATQHISKGRLPDGSTIVALHRSGVTTVANGETIVLPMGSTSETRRIYLFVTPTIMAAGEVVESTAHPTESAKATTAPKMPWSAMLTVRTLAIPLDEALPPLEQLTLQSNGTSDNPPASDDYALAGIFTGPQLEVFLRDIQNQSGADQFKESKETVTAQDPTRQFAASKTGESALEVTTSTGAFDGQTLGLVVRPPAAEGKQALTTAVTVWDGQTVLLARRAGATDQRKLSEAIFITTNLIK